MMTATLFLRSNGAKTASPIGFQRRPSLLLQAVLYPAHEIRKTHQAQRADEHDVRMRPPLDVTRVPMVYLTKYEQLKYGGP